MGLCEREKKKIILLLWISPEQYVVLTMMPYMYVYKLAWPRNRTTSFLQIKRNNSVRKPKIG